MIEELANHLEWNEDVEYRVNKNGYSGDETVSLLSDGIADILQFVRNNRDGDRAE